MAKSAERIERSLERMRRLGRVLSVVFTVLFVITVIGVLGIINEGVRGLSLGGQIADGAIWLPDGDRIFMLPCALALIIGISIEVILLIFSVTVARGDSPFTLRNARLVLALGVVFWLNAASMLISSSDTVLSIRVGSLFTFSYTQSPLTLTLFPEGPVIDAGSLLGAFVCFAIAAMWRYAALLQAQSDDLV